MPKNGTTSTQDWPVAAKPALGRHARHGSERPAQPCEPLTELAKRQGVSPATDLDAISSLWPAEDDPEELLRYILNERSARRRLAGAGK